MSSVGCGRHLTLFTKKTIIHDLVKIQEGCPETALTLEPDLSFLRCDHLESWKKETPEMLPYFKIQEDCNPRFLQK